jgi:hypothetical protein
MVKTASVAPPTAAAHPSVPPPSGKKRGRPKGPFTQARRLETLRALLLRHPKGLTIYELAARAGRHAALAPTLPRRGEARHRALSSPAFDKPGGAACGASRPSEAAQGRGAPHSGLRAARRAAPLRADEGLDPLRRDRPRRRRSCSVSRAAPGAVRTPAWPTLAWRTASSTCPSRRKTTGRRPKSSTISSRPSPICGRCTVGTAAPRTASEEKHPHPPVRDGALQGRDLLRRPARREGRSGPSSSIACATPSAPSESASSCPTTSRIDDHFEGQFGIWRSGERQARGDRVRSAGRASTSRRGACTRAGDRDDRRWQAQADDDDRRPHRAHHLGARLR